MVPVVMAISLIAAIAFLISRESAILLDMAVGQSQVSRAQYVAEAGFQHAHWRIQQANCSGYTNLATTVFGSDSYSATVTDAAGNPVSSGSPVTINATGVFNNDVSRGISRGNIKVYQPAVSAQFQPGAEGKDSYIEGDSGKQDNNNGDDDRLKTNSDASELYRALIQFEISSIPAGMTVFSALLNLELFSDSGSASVVEAYGLTQSWTEDGVTWEAYDGPNFWITPGGDYDPLRVASFVASGTGLKSTDFAPLVQSWVDGTKPNYGIILLSTPEAGDNEKRYYSSEHGTPSQRPELTIVYACECGASCV